MASELYKTFDHQTKELINHFLSFGVPIDRPPSQRELDSIAAFRLLFHAEVEHFIDDRVEFAIISSFRSWQSNVVVNSCLLNLCLSFMDDTGMALKSLSRGLERNVMENLLLQITGKARTAIKDNNSIKHESFTTLSH